ncbi:DUF4349 domain-containing protein [Nocardioides sp.]|uniref:DUF4349 domain-containing protein n=1 Tax=Nocardioides sp. TaxID=35761 RepID=UPI003562A296
MTTTSRRRGLATAAALSILFVAGACGGSDDATSAGDAGSVEAPQLGAPDERGADGTDLGGDMAYDTDLGSVDAAAEVASSASGASGGGVANTKAGRTTEQKVISNGNVQLKSDDVGQAVFDVRDVVDVYAGEVDANSTETDDEGEPLRARLRIRIPTEQFDEAMQDLGRVATLISSSGNSKDVTTQVIDNEIRIKIQRRSIERISLLLDRATSIRDIVNIEAQLSNRQADLESLETEQRYLADQTSMATITVSVERIKEKKDPVVKEDNDGFFAGLSAGWDALKSFGIGLATVLGALLPWFLVGVLIAIPGWPLLRRLRRRSPGINPAGPDPEPSPTS